MEALGDVAAATVVEIGPGRGVLTDLLAGRAGRLIAIELDRVLASQMRLKYVRHPNVEVIEGDALQVDFANLVARRPAPILVNQLQAVGQTHERAHVVGNLPYYITSDILLHLLQAHEWLETIVIMVQREVAERIAAKPGSRDYGLLSATVQLYCDVEKLFTLPPAAFSPPPKVHSSVLRLSVAPKTAKLGVEINKFMDFLKLAFAQKRKTLVNNLKLKYAPAAIERSLSTARTRKDARAEALSLEQMAIIFRSLKAAASPSP